MENLHLLKIEMGVEEYLAISKIVRRPGLVARLPAYTIAICPYCNKDNSEHLNTYSSTGWDLKYGSRLFGMDGIAFHCEHYVLSHFFINFHNIWPMEAKGYLTPEVPHVIGHILENGSSLAVMHALPMCRPENGQFVPRYTLYMLTYFSEKQNVLQDVTNYNAAFFEETTAAYIVPPEDCQHWWDLPRWVSEKKLLWLDASGEKLRLTTGDSSRFPYKNITGRKENHTFPYPYQPPNIRFDNSKNPGNFKPK